MNDKTAIHIERKNMSHTKIPRRIIAPALVLAATNLIHAAPLGTTFTYQGSLYDAGAPANGHYDLTFSLFNDPVVGVQIGTTWTNLNVSVGNGLFTTPVDFGTGIFDGTAYWLAIGVRTNGSGAAFSDLAPRQPVSPSPYALFATTAPIADNAVNSLKILDGTISAADLGPNSVNSTHIVNGQVMNVDLANSAVDSAKVLDGSLAGVDLANNTVTSLQLADSISLGDAAAAGRLDVYKIATGGPAISLFGNGTGGYQYLFQDDGQIGIYLDGDSGGGGLQYLYAADGSIGISLDGESGGAGLITIYNTNSSTRLSLDGSGTGAGGQINVYSGDGSIGLTLFGDNGGAGLVALYNTNSSTRVVLDGLSLNGGGEISVYDANGSESIELLGAYGSTFGGVIRAKQADGSIGVEIFSEAYAGDGGLISIKNAAGTEKLELDGDDGDGAPAIRLHNAAGTTTITLDGDLSGDGRITTQELQITGGSDLSEQFDITPLQGSLTPGTVVCIDPTHPGRLIPSTQAYDRTVAGVLSGAGGVKPGMLMRQAGTAADGQHPVALSGRVYCCVDADRGAIRPGDLLTTSETPGHAMKVTNHQQSQGAVLGKAMSGLDQGKGLVLVLVSLQ
jgi:hypothetical protein